MTSVLGHLTSLEFADRYRKWATTPPAQLFDAETVTLISKVSSAARTCGQIAHQIRTASPLPTISSSKPDTLPFSSFGRIVTEKASILARRSESRPARRILGFRSNEPGSATPRNGESLSLSPGCRSWESHVIQAAQSPIELDDLQATAVATRIELDLRIGAAFTRLQCLQLKPLGAPINEMTISYGSCQFPTLGFVVERYFRVKKFKPEPFWAIKVTHVRDKKTVNFTWKRGHLFDRAIVTILFEKCLDSKHAKVIKMQKKPTSKWRPLPLTTVELQMQGTRFLRMDSKKIMAVAEKLYQGGWISYPRTETDQFPKEFDLQGLIQKQTVHTTWGTYAQGLVAGGFTTPRSGRNNDQAHPPIHPVNCVAPTQLSDEERRVYEFVTRRFLACCSEDAKGEATDIGLLWGDEIFSTHGLLVLARNYLDIYVYDKWESSQQLPTYQLNETFELIEAKMVDGKTTAPSFMTEPELLGLMDANGIGTDATMADHVAMIKERQYIVENVRSGGGRTAVKELIPTLLGVALVEGYDNLGLDISVSKPFLRKELELKIKAICEGRKTRRDVIHECVEQYQEVFLRTQRNISVLKTAVRKYVFEDDTP